MRVALGRQTEVPQILRVVPGLLHRPQHQERDGLLFRLSGDLLDQSLEIAGPDGLP
ncbi:hypothetical protein D3C83_312990 [compost metagenome]